MRKYYLDITNLSMNKYGEELCGDNVEIVKIPDGMLVVMSDGLGSGVKANILGTLTSKIAITMLKEGATIDETIDTIINTLPECQVRKLAYSTFTIVKIKNDGEVYMVEYDNPPVFLFRSNRSSHIEKVKRIVNDKVIYESRFYMCEDDTLVVISDGVVHAGVGGLLNLGWELPHIDRYLTNLVQKEKTARGICSQLISTCKDLYDSKPGDDTTAVVIRLHREKNISLFIGPPKKKIDDSSLITLVKSVPGKKIVCGGTTSNIIANGLKSTIEMDLTNFTAEVPPCGYMEGVDLVTEGLLTLSKVKDILTDYINKSKTSSSVPNIAGNDGASKIVSILINEGTNINFYVGEAINPAHEDTGYPQQFNLKLQIIKDIMKLLKELNKKVSVRYL